MKYVKIKISVTEVATNHTAKQHDVTEAVRKAAAKAYDVYASSELCKLTKGLHLCRTVR